MGSVLSDADKRIRAKSFFSFHEDSNDRQPFFKSNSQSSTVHTDGLPDVQAKNAGGSTQAQTAPCPSSVDIRGLAQFNHGDLPAADKEKWGTYLGVTSQMNVGPGPDHTGHCMKEKLTTVSNNCPAQVYSRGGESESQPCTGNRCLDINKYGSAGDASTHSMLSDGPTSFIDMHRTRHPSSLLEGSGVNACSVVCEQIYLCDRTSATTGKFRITRNYKADSFTKKDGTSMHITTGDVNKELVQSGSQPITPHGPLGDFNVTDEIKHTA
ncbi:MAG: hypothetical protein ACXVA2_18330 [Mucilaginibacter sp.]